MSDAAVAEALDRMERLLEAGDWDPEVLAAWKADFDRSVRSAERGPTWPSLLQRAHRLGARLESAIPGLVQESEAIKRELASQVQGALALKAYRPA